MWHDKRHPDALHRDVFGRPSDLVIKTVMKTITSPNALDDGYLITSSEHLSIRPEVIG